MVGLALRILLDIWEFELLLPVQRLLLAIELHLDLSIFIIHTLFLLGADVGTHELPLSSCCYFGALVACCSVPFQVVLTSEHVWTVLPFSLASLLDFDFWGKTHYFKSQLAV